MKLKKITAILLAMAMAFAFTVSVTACGGSGDEEAQTEAAAEADAQAQEEEESDYDTEVYDIVAGFYQDEVTERATAEVAGDPEAKNAKITVNWGQDAWTQMIWEMNATYEDGKFVYKDCQCLKVTYDDNLAETGKEVVSENEEGYFVLDGKGRLCWEGAGDADRSQMVFVKMEE